MGLGYVCSMYMCAFDFEHANVSLGSFGAFFSKKGAQLDNDAQGNFGVIWCTCMKMVCNSKEVSVEKSGVKFGSWGSCKQVYGYL